MLDPDEVSRSLTGAWRLFLDKPEAMRFFDLSVGGFWRSFGAVILVAPAYVVSVMGQRHGILASMADSAQFPDLLYFVDRLAALLLSWVALPIVLAFLARPLGFAPTYSAFITARNWCAVLETIPFGVIALLFLIGAASADVAALLTLVAVIVVLRFDFIIARRALGASIGFAVGVVVLDLALGLIISAGADALFGL